MLSEMRQDRQRQIWHDFTYMWNLKNKNKKWKNNKNRPRYREQAGGCQKERSVEGHRG